MVLGRERLAQFCDHTFGVFDRLLHRDKNKLLSRETLLAVNFDIDGEDDAIGGFDFGFAEFVLDPHRTLRFDLDLVTKRFGGFLELLRGHVCVSDPGGTSSDGNDLHTAGSFF